MCIVLQIRCRHQHCCFAILDIGCWCSSVLMLTVPSSQTTASDRRLYIIRRLRYDHRLYLLDGQRDNNRHHAATVSIDREGNPYHCRRSRVFSDGSIHHSRRCIIIENLRRRAEGGRQCWRCFCFVVGAISGVAVCFQSSRTIVILGCTIIS